MIGVWALGACHHPTGRNVRVREHVPNSGALPSVVHLPGRERLDAAALWWGVQRQWPCWLCGGA